jgi:hypothetical protein
MPLTASVTGSADVTLTGSPTAIAVDNAADEAVRAIAAMITNNFLILMVCLLLRYYTPIILQYLSKINVYLMSKYYNNNK